MCAGVQQIGPSLHPPEDPHRGEALQVSLLSLQRLQAGHDHSPPPDSQQIRTPRVVFNRWVGSLLLQTGASQVSCLMRNILLKFLHTSAGRPPVSRRVSPKTPLTTDSLETPLSLRDNFPWMLSITTGKQRTTVVYCTVYCLHLIPTGYQGNFPRVDFHETSRRTEYQSISQSRHFSLIGRRQVFRLNLHEISR